MTFTVAVPLARHGGVQLQLAAIAECSVDPVTAQSFFAPRGEGALGAGS